MPDVPLVPEDPVAPVAPGGPPKGPVSPLGPVGPVGPAYSPKSTVTKSPAVTVFTNVPTKFRPVTPGVILL